MYVSGETIQNSNRQKSQVKKGKVERTRLRFSFGFGALSFFSTTKLNFIPSNLMYQPTFKYVYMERGEKREREEKDHPYMYPTLPVPYR